MKKILIILCLILFVSIIHAGYRGDSLGNHIAKKNINLNSFQMNNIRDLIYDNSVEITTFTDVNSLVGIEYRGLYRIISWKPDNFTAEIDRFSFDFDTTNDILQMKGWYLNSIYGHIDWGRSNAYPSLRLKGEGGGGVPSQIDLWDSARGIEFYQNNVEAMQIQGSSVSLKVPVDMGSQDINNAGTVYGNPSGDGSGLTEVLLKITCKAGENITLGDVVYVSGAVGNFPQVMKADAFDSSKDKAFGIAAETKTSGQNILVVRKGDTPAFNTSDLTLGSLVFLGATGDLYDNYPSSGSVIAIGYCTNSHITQGIISVDIDPIMNYASASINEDYDIRMGKGARVVIEDGDDNDLIWWNKSSGTLTGVEHWVSTVNVMTSGTDHNSPPIRIKADSGGTEVESTIYTAYGADPYLRVSVDDDDSTPALTAVIDIHDTVIAFPTDNIVDIGAPGANRPKDIHCAGNIVPGGTVDGVTVSAIALDNMPTTASSNISMDNQDVNDVGDIDVDVVTGSSATFSGDVEANAFHGDGSDLTGVTSPQTVTLLVAAPDASADVIDVADFVVSGLAEDEINAAISSVAVTSGKIKLSEGTFWANDNIVLDSTGVFIVGTGWGTVIKATDNASGLGTNEGIISLAGGGNYGLLKFTLDGNKANNTVQFNGIFVDNVDNFLLQDLRIQNFDYDGVANIAAGTAHSFESIITSCIFTDVRYGLYTFWMSSITVSNCIYNHVIAGFLTDNWFCSSIINNVVTNASSYGIYLNGSDDMNVTGNTLITCTDGIHIAQNCQYVNVTGNIMANGTDAVQVANANNGHVFIYDSVAHNYTNWLTNSNGVETHTSGNSFASVDLNISPLTDTPYASALLAVDSNYDLYVSSGNTESAWIPVGTQSP